MVVIFFFSLCSLRYALCFLLFALCAVSSCAPKYAEKPSREGITLGILEKLNNIQSIEAVLSMDYEKNDSTMSGDAFLKYFPLLQWTLEFIILAFLAGEVKEDNGVIKSKPKIDKYKSIVLVDGLRNSFLWWTISDYNIEDREDTYVLRNFNRKLIISKRTCFLWSRPSNLIMGTR